MSRVRRRSLTYEAVPRLDAWLERMAARPAEEAPPAPDPPEQVELIEGFRGFGPAPARKPRRRTETP